MEKDTFLENQIVRSSLDFPAFVGDYYLLLNSELFDWIMLFRYHILQVIHLEFFVCQKINVFIIFTSFMETLFCQYLIELFELSLKVWCKLWISFMSIASWDI